MYGKEAVVRALVEAGCDTEAETSDGEESGTMMLHTLRGAHAIISFVRTASGRHAPVLLYTGPVVHLN